MKQHVKIDNAAFSSIVVVSKDDWLKILIGDILHINQDALICVDSLDLLDLTLPGYDSSTVLIDALSYTRLPTEQLKEILALYPNLRILLILDCEGVSYAPPPDNARLHILTKENMDHELPFLLQHANPPCQGQIPIQIYQEEGVRMETEATGLFDKSINRRSFLKGSAAAVGAVAVLGSGGNMLRALADNDEAATAAAGEETIFKSVCRVNCSAQTCQMNVHVRNGHVVKTSMSPLQDSRYNRICLRGLGHPQRINHPDRIKYPMKRMDGTERGAGQWEQISWDEAIDTIADKMNSARAEYGDQAVAFSRYWGNQGALNGDAGIYVRLFNTIGATVVHYSVDQAVGVGHSRVGGGGLNEPADWINAKTFFAWGSNIAESRIHDWHFLADAIEDGTKLVVIDPKFTQTASKAHQFVPLRPGSDVALAFSMMQVIIEENIYDEEFVMNYTDATFLVREDTKLFLRQSDITGEAVAEDETDPYMVWNSLTNQAGTVDEVKVPALEGSYTVNGIKVNTAFQLLKNMVADYTPEEAVKFTDVEPEMTREIARLAADGPATFHLGYGPNTYDNGDLYGQYLASLAALTGNIGKAGASYGGCFYVPAPVTTTAIQKPDNLVGPTMSQMHFVETLKTGQYCGNPYPIKVWFQAFGNILSNSMDQRTHIDKMLPALDLVVVAEMTMTDSARHADIVLPAAHYFEMDELVYAVGQVHMQWSEKAVNPPYEAKTDVEIARLLAPKLGVEKHFTQSDEEFHRMFLETDALKALGITYETLKENRSIRFAQDPYIPYASRVFSTPSGRCHFYTEKTTPRMNYGQEVNHDRQRLTGFYPPAEAWPDNPLFEKYPLVCTNSHSKWRAHSSWYDEPWLLELNPEPTIEINSEDAAARSIKTGDMVEAYNDRGHAVLKAVVTSGIKSGVVDIPKGWQRHQFKEGGYGELSGTIINEIVLNQSFFDVLIEVRKV